MTKDEWGRQNQTIPPPSVSNFSLNTQHQQITTIIIKIKTSTLCTGAGGAGWLGGGIGAKRTRDGGLGGGGPGGGGGRGCVVNSWWRARGGGMAGGGPGGGCVATGRLKASLTAGGASSASWSPSTAHTVAVDPCDSASSGSSLPRSGADSTNSSSSVTPELVCTKHPWPLSI